ncbi:hypothetical protein QR680_017920 [Steinernema hermaphroditum]|uniref:Uncharacterized protein n=1 Tax=Steinernema hermaphroditum TaxID=289476 RepID=A0AA39HH85_9BILA|nr:hypothetical protein QR680_017920 [Steinernema hermaphroditum]
MTTIFSLTDSASSINIGTESTPIPTNMSNGQTHLAITATTQKVTEHAKNQTLSPASSTGATTTKRDQSTDVGCNRISISDDVGTCHHFYFITFPHISYNDSKKYGLKEFTDFDCRRNHNRNIHRWHIYRILHDIDIYVHFETHHCSNI